METITLSAQGQAEMDKITKVERTKAAVMIIKAIADTIKELGRIPNGHLYAQVMGKLSYADYCKAIEILKGGKLITESNSELIWIG